MTSIHSGEYTNIAVPQSLLSQAHLDDAGPFSFELHGEGLLITRSKKSQVSDFPAFGIWKDKNIDAVEMQQKLRAEWDEGII